MTKSNQPGEPVLKPSHFPYNIDIIKSFEDVKVNGFEYKITFKDHPDKYFERPQDRNYAHIHVVWNFKKISE